jgi:hypothetical protein
MTMTASERQSNFRHLRGMIGKDYRGTFVCHNHCFAQQSSQFKSCARGRLGWDCLYYIVASDLGYNQLFQLGRASGLLKTPRGSTILLRGRPGHVSLETMASKFTTCPIVVVNTYRRKRVYSRV